MILGTAYFVLKNTLEGQLQQVSQSAYEVASIFLSRLGCVFAGMFIAVRIDASSSDGFKEFYYWQYVPQTTIQLWLIARKALYFIFASTVSVFVLHLLFPIMPIMQTIFIFLASCLVSFFWFRVSRSALSKTSTSLPQSWQYALLRLKLFSSEKFFFFLGILISSLVIYVVYIKSFKSIHAHYLFALAIGMIVSILQASDIERQLKSSWLDILSGKTHDQFISLFAFSGGFLSLLFGTLIFVTYYFNTGNMDGGFNLVLLPVLPPIFTAVLLFQIDPSKTIVLISLVTLVSLFLGSLCILHPIGYLASFIMVMVAASQQQHRLYPYVGERVT